MSVIKVSCIIKNTRTGRFTTTDKRVSELRHEVLTIVEIARVERIERFTVLTRYKTGKYYGV